VARSVLDVGQTREVPFSAYARRQLRQRLLIAGLGMVLLLGAWLLYRELRPHGGDTAGTYRALLRCTSCGHEWGQSVRLEERFPLPCPKCGALAAQPVWLCHVCGHAFVPQQRGGIVRCPRCGSDRVGSAATAPHEHAPVGAP